MRHALTHRAEAGEWAEAWQLAADMGFLEAKCRELGAHEIEADVARAAKRCRASGDEALGQRFDDLARALVRESHWLREAPEATAALVWNRLRRSGWSATDIDEQLRIPAEATFLRVQQVATRESPALMRDLVGHVSWAIACAVTPDDRRVISASHDQTLKVWDLDTYACLLTHRGDAPYTAVAAPIRLAALSHLPSGRSCRRFPRHKHVILFLAANPSGTTRLALEEECAAIERELRMTTGRDDFDFRSKWAVSVDEMMRHMNELQPTVIHFSGHGGGSADICLQDDQRQPASAHRDIGAAAGAGIQLQDDQRQPQHVTARALTQMISSAAPSARVVVLNACFSDAVAEALRGVVDCVVGMRGAIGDDAARSVGNAVAQAVAALAAKLFPDEHLPVCRTRDGLNADQVILPSLDSHRS